MISVSEQFQREMAENSGSVLKGELTLSGGKTVSLSGDDFMMGGTSLTQAVSSSGSFDIGAAIIGSCSISLNNIDGRFDGYDFTDATIRVYIGKELSSGKTEWVRKPRFYVDQPSSYGSVIELSGLDSMSLFERPYSDVSTKYPASLNTIVSDICSKCGVILASSQFKNRDYVVSRRPDDDSLTCLAVLSYAAQVAGCWCRVDNQDRLVVDWYDLSAWEGEAWLDGGSFDGSATPYADGDDADGGTFDSYGASTGTAADGGGFSGRQYAVVSAFSSMTLCTDDVVITGVQVTAADDLSEDEGGTGEAGETSLAGSEGYVLAVEDNPLVLFGQAEKVAAQIYEAVGGMRFRPFDASAVGDPSIEAGDPALVVDKLSNMYKTFITSYTYAVGGYATARCDAETPSRHSASSFSAATKAIVDLRNNLKEERTRRQQAIENLQRELANSSGLYETEDVQDDGSVIYYFHDKPTLAESSIVWKYTAEAMGISTDGGKTYPYGLDVSGDAILNRIYAIGLDADYLRTGAITVSKDGRTMFSADIDTGDVTIDAANVLIGSSLPIQDYVDIAKVQYGTCSTAASVQKKVVDGISMPENGMMLVVRFTNANTASNPTIQAGGTTAPIKVGSAAMGKEDWWEAGDTLSFVYSSGAWYLADNGLGARIQVLNDSVTISVGRIDELEDGLGEVSGKTPRYATCSTAAATVAKDATLSGSEKFELSPGVQVAVRFTNANTAENPTLNVGGTGAKYIVIGGTYLSEDFFWKAGDLLVFTYTGSWWALVDGASYKYSRSEIKALADSISLKVTNGALGKTASIVIEADGTKHTASVDLSDVRQSFADDPTSITITSGRVTFNTGTFVVNSTYFKVNSSGVITATSGTIGGFTIGSSSIYNEAVTLSGTGISVSYSSENIGYIHTNAWVDDNSVRGLAFDLQANGEYMAWGSKNSSSDTSFTWRVLFAQRAFSRYAAKSLNIDCRLDVWGISYWHNYTAENFWFNPSNGGADGGITIRTASFILIKNMNSDGTASLWSTGCYLQFKAGVLIGCALPQ